MTIRLEHLEKKFEDGGTVLKDVNATIRDGDVISLIGPSGTGKSTLLRCINMLGAPTGGKIFLDDVEVTAPGADLSVVHRKIHMVFQSFNLFEHLSVIENVMLPQMAVLKRSRQEAYDKAMDLLTVVGMAEKGSSFPPALSGGQKQRVAIARTLAMDPEVILFDEPTSALDPSMVDEVKAVIRDVARSGVTIMIVTHDMAFARKIANRIFYMDQGIIYEEGTPEEIFDRPRKERTKKFIRRVKILEEKVTSKLYDLRGLLSKISAFTARTEMSRAAGWEMQSVTEELMPLLLSRLPEEFQVRFSYGYSEERQRATVRVAYSGKQFDMLKDVAEKAVASGPDGDIDPEVISLKILEGNAKEIEYSFDPERELPNEIRFYLK